MATSLFPRDVMTDVALPFLLRFQLLPETPSDLEEDSGRRAPVCSQPEARPVACTGAPLSPRDVAAAITLIRASETRAKNDGYPRDIASPTALYLGVAVMAAAPDLDAPRLALTCRIRLDDADEYFSLVVIAARSSWIKASIVDAARAALLQQPIEADSRPQPALAPAQASARSTRIEEEIQRDLKTRMQRSGTVDIWGLDSSRCKWPLGEPGDDAFRFCGDARADRSSYCAHHHQIAYPPRVKA
jgi:hypothetical protein